MATPGVKSLLQQQKEEKDRDLECPICLTEYKEPKLLPCLHTFCEDCLTKYCHEKDDDKIPCPICRSKFCVPQGGVDKLPDNQFIVRLIHQKGHQEKKCNCDPCREIGEDIKADSFCMECRRSLCHRCTKLHSNQSYTKQHKVVSIAEKPTDYELQRLMSSYCKEHGNKELELYCCDCRKLVCVLCHAQDHNKHDCRVSCDIARRKKELSENDRKNIEKFRVVASERKQMVVKAKQDFLQKVWSTEYSLKKSVDTVRKLLDIYEEEMLEELNSIKKNRIKELESEKDLEELDYTTLDSFHTYSRMMMERGTDCEIIGAADDLHRRAEELIKDQEKKDTMDHDETQLKFIEPVTLMPEDIKKLVGKILYRPTDKNTSGRGAWPIAGSKVDIIQVNAKWITINQGPTTIKIAGVTVVDDEIFVVGQRQSYLKAYDSRSLTYSRCHVVIPGMTSPTDLAGCSYNKALYIGDSTLRCIHRFDLNNNSVTSWNVRENHTLQWGISMTNEHNVLVTVSACEKGKKEKNLIAEYTSEGQLVREIRLDFTHYAWQAIQLSGDQFVVCHRWCHDKLSLINAEGQIIKSYGGESGGRECRLHFPSSIAIDNNSKHIFMVEYGTTRILMLDTDLTYLGQVHAPHDLQEPGDLYFDSSTDRLIVLESNGDRVLVISPSH